jgi:phage tail-like protein
MPFAPPRGEDHRTPFGNFGFHVSFPNGSRIFHGMQNESTALLGGFSEVSGLEASMEHKVIKEGGRNYGSAMRVGQTSFGTVVLKRGIVSSRHLWRWWSLVSGADGASDPMPTAAHRTDVLIGLIQRLAPPPPSASGPSPAAAGDNESAHQAKVAWKLKNALPVKFKVGDLNARGTDVAVEELHLVHEGLWLESVA